MRVGRASSVGGALVPTGGALVPAGGALVPAGGALVPAGRVNSAGGSSGTGSGFRRFFGNAMDSFANMSPLTRSILAGLIGTGIGYEGNELYHDWIDSQ